MPDIIEKINQAGHLIHYFSISLDFDYQSLELWQAQKIIPQKISSTINISTYANEKSDLNLFFQEFLDCTKLQWTDFLNGRDSVVICTGSTTSFEENIPNFYYKFLVYFEGS